MTDKKRPSEDWMQTRWRPAMGWMYMIVCVCDFTLFPVLWSLLQALSHGQVTSQWQPITLQGAGLFHLAMGAVLGVAAWSRGQEKIAGNASNIPTPSFQQSPQNYQPINTVSQASAPSTFSASPAIVGFGGKAAPPPVQEQLL
jgi:Holin of 3TMs, for gene-transfer release